MQYVYAWREGAAIWACYENGQCMRIYERGRGIGRYTACSPEKRVRERCEQKERNSARNKAPAGRGL